MKIIELDKTYIFDLLDLCKAIGWLQDKAFMKNNSKCIFLSVHLSVICMKIN